MLDEGFVIGMGKVPASLGSYEIFRTLKPQVAVLAGIAGGYEGSGVGLGDVIVSTEEVMVDEGRRGVDWLRPIFRDFPRYKLFAPELHFKKGVFNTVSSVSGDRKVAKLYRDLTGALCENMEGAAVAESARLFGVKLVEIRVVSNICGWGDIDWSTLDRLRDSLLILREFFEQYDPL